MAAGGDGINTKVGVLGNKEYKAAMKEMGNQLALMKSELQAATSGFDKNDKSMAALTARANGLKGVYDAQAAKVKFLTEQLEAAKGKYGEGSKQVGTLQIALNRATAEMNKTGLECKKTGKAIEKGGKDAETSGKRHEKLAEAMKKVGGVASKAMISGAKAAAAAVAAMGAATGAAVKGGFDLAKGAGAYADDLLTASTVTGVSAQKLQEWSYAARFIDTDVDTMTKSMTKMTKTMGDAAGGSKSAKNTFRKLGIVIKDNKGQMRDQQEVFAEAIDALGRMSNETERDALAMELFGKSAKELNPLIEAGGEALKRAGEEAHRMGAVFSDDALKSMGAFDDSMQRAQATGDALKRAIGLTMIPAFKPLVDTASSAMADVAVAMQDGLQPGELDSIVDKLMQAAGTAISQLSKIVESALPIVLGAVEKIVGGVAKKLPGFLKKILPAAQRLIKALMGALVNNIGPIARGIGQIVGQIGKILIQHLPEILSAIGQMVNAIIAELTGVDLSGAFSGMLAGVASAWDAIKTSAAAVWDAVGGIFSTAWDAIKGVFTGVLKWASGVWGDIKAGFDGVVTWFSDLFGGESGAWAAIKGAFTGVLKWASGVWGDIKAGFDGVVTWFSDLFGGENGAWAAIKGAFTGVLKWASGVWGDIKAGFDSVVTWFSDLFGGENGAWAAIKGAFTGVTEWASGVWGDIKAGFDGVVDWFKGIFGNAWNAIKEFFGGKKAEAAEFDSYGGRSGSLELSVTPVPEPTGIEAFNATLQGLYSLEDLDDWYATRFSGVMKVLSSGASAVENMLNDMQSIAEKKLDAQAAAKLGEKFGAGLVLGIIRKAASAVSSVRGFADLVLRTAQAALSPIAGATVGSDFSAGIAVGLSSGGSRVYSAARGMLQGALDAVRGVTDRFWSVGEAIAEGMAQGIRRGTPGVVLAAQQAANRAYLASKKTLDIHSPSRRMAEIGMQFDAGLAQGITRGLGAVQRAAAGVSDGAARSVSPGGGRGIDYRALGDAVADSFIRRGLGRPIIELDGEKVGAAIEPSVSRESWQRGARSVSGRGARLILT